MLNHFFKIVLITLICASPAQYALAQVKGGKYDQMKAEVLQLINDHRKDMGLGALTNNEMIAKAAEQHSKDMATKKIPFGHDGFDKRMGALRKQLKNAYGWAENVAEGAKTAADVVDMWLHSPGHKKNIEGDFNTSGIGIVAAKDGSLYFTQIFFKVQ